MLQRPSPDSPAQRELYELLTRLAGEPERMARGVSQCTVDTDWFLARKLLSREMGIDG